VPYVLWLRREGAACSRGPTSNDFDIGDARPWLSPDFVRKLVDNVRAGTLNGRREGASQFGH
jgi:hypothetical protein